MSEKVYRVVFQGKRAISKSPLYNTKSACYRWVESQSHRVLSDLMLYEIDKVACKQGEEYIASAFEYKDLNYIEGLSTNALNSSEVFACKLSDKAMWPILNSNEINKLGGFNY